MTSHKKSKQQVQEDKSLRPAERADARAARVQARRSEVIANGKQREGDLRKGRDTDR